MLHKSVIFIRSKKLLKIYKMRLRLFSVYIKLIKYEFKTLNIIKFLLYNITKIHGIYLKILPRI